MSTSGSLRDTYVAALQHGHHDPGDDELLVGVVRRPTPWFSAEVDENRAALGPPADLLSAAKERQADLATGGLDDARAHDRAWADVGFERRYREHVETDGAARDAVDDLRETLAGGRDVTLVCYENTDQKRCHRTILREYVVSDR